MHGMFVMEVDVGSLSGALSNVQNLLCSCAFASLPPFPPEKMAEGVSRMSSHLRAYVLFHLNTTQNDDPSGVFVDLTTIRSKAVSYSLPETLRCSLKVYVGETQETLF